ncbi:hypothetical protein D3C78_1274930 [compost metagenome]
MHCFPFFLISFSDFICPMLGDVFANLSWIDIIRNLITYCLLDRGECFGLVGNPWRSNVTVSYELTIFANKKARTCNSNRIIYVFIVRSQFTVFCNGQVERRRAFNFDFINVAVGNQNDAVLIFFVNLGLRKSAFKTICSRS